MGTSLLYSVTFILTQHRQIASKKSGKQHKSALMCRIFSQMFSIRFIQSIPESEIAIGPVDNPSTGPKQKEYG